MSWRLVQPQSSETIIKWGPTRALTQYEATIFQVRSPPICPSTYNALIARPSLPGCPPNNSDEVVLSPVHPAQAAALCSSDGLTTLEMDR